MFLDAHPVGRHRAVWWNAQASQLILFVDPCVAGLHHLCLATCRGGGGPRTSRVERSLVLSSLLPL